MKEGCRVTPGGGNPRESATEKSLPPRFACGSLGVMVKRWGKSPPRTGQPGRHGKPHPEQCRIGALRGKVCDCQRRKPKATAETSTGRLQPKGPGWQLDPVGNGGGRGMVIQRRKPWTESGLQAIRANSKGGRVLSPFGACRVSLQDILEQMKPFHLLINIPAGGRPEPGVAQPQQARC